MLNPVLYAFSVALITVGAFFLLSLAIGNILCKKDERRVFTLIFCDGDYDKLCDRVYSAFYGCDFFSLFRKRDIIVIGGDVPERVKRQCRDIIAPFGKVYFLKGHEFAFVGEDFFH